MKKIQSLYLVLLVFLSATSVYSHEMRTWTAMNGSTMEAAFIKYEEPNVHMQKRDGTILKVNRDNLSDEDWVYVMQFDPSIFSLWIKLGKPTAMEVPYLEAGQLPRIYKEEPVPRTSLFVSSDERMCIQTTDSTPNGWCKQLICPISPLFFDKKPFPKSVYLDLVSGHLFQRALDQDKNLDNALWVCDLESYGAIGFLVRVNLQYGRNSGTNFRMSTPSRVNNPVFECKVWSNGSSGGCEYDWFSLGDLYAQRRDCFMRIPRFKRIDSLLHAKNAGAPKEAFIPPAAKNLISTGSGFFISQDGYFLTNYHVVKGSRKLQLMTSSGVVKARVVRIEPDVDLALLKAESGTYSTLSFAQLTAPTLGEDIFTIGFPMPDIQGFSPKMTKGVISSLNGIQDEDLNYQIDASIQPGNSGGPLVNNNGELVGVIVASLRDSYIAEKKGVIPQNVNYAIKAKHVIDFLEQVPDCRKQITFSNQPKIQTSATPETIEAVQSACAMVMVFE